MPRLPAPAWRNPIQKFHRLMGRDQQFDPILRVEAPAMLVSKLPDDAAVGHLVQKAGAAQRLRKFATIGHHYSATRR